MGFVRRFTSWFDRRRRVVLGTFGAWILVAAASAGSSPGDRGWVGVPDLSWVLVAFFVVLVPLGLALSFYLLRGDRQASEPVKRRPASYWIAALLFLAVFAALRVLSDDVDEADDDEPIATVDEVPEIDDRRAGSGDDGRARSVAASDIAVAATATAVAAAALWWLRRASTVEAEPVARPAGAMAPAFDQAIADLELGDDPRRAVLRAYATLERASADRGRPRLDHETAAEHLRRALGALPIDPDELVELGRLYERARFSSSVTPESARDRARAILDRARADIRRAERGAVESRG